MYSYDEQPPSVVNYTALTESNFAPEPVNLEEHYVTGGDYTAVEVYVERLAAKVDLDVNSGILWSNSNQGNTKNIEVTETMFEDWAKAPESVSGYTYVIRLLGFDVDGVARDAKLVKDIEPFASSLVSAAGFSVWNVADNYRCYWAASEAYGDEEVTYPAGNWKGNTAEDEDTDPLNKYLRYVDLQNPVEIGSTTYCGENTNTADVITAETDSSMNCLTQVLMKAQFGYEDNNNGTFNGVDIVKYHGEYLTLDDFENDMIAEVEHMDFTSMVNDVVAAIEEQIKDNTTLKDLLSGVDLDAVFAELASDVEPVIYYKKTEDGEGYEQFDNRFMQLYSQNDGKVSIWFNTDTSVDTEGNGRWNTSDVLGNAIPDYYTQTILDLHRKKEVKQKKMYLCWDITYVKPLRKDMTLKERKAGSEPYPVISQTYKCIWTLRLSTAPRPV